MGGQGTNALHEHRIRKSVRLHEGFASDQFAQALAAGMCAWTLVGLKSRLPDPAVQDLQAQVEERPMATGVSAMTRDAMIRIDIHIVLAMGYQMSPETESPHMRLLGQ